MTSPFLPQGTTMKRILAALSMAAITAAPFAANAAAAANTLTYSGYLVKAGGGAETANVSVTFALYDVATGGAPLWSESDSITPSADGWFSTTLGDGTPFPAAVDFSQQLYLGIKVGLELEMAPRVKVGNAPRALSAEWSALNGIPAPCSGSTPVLQGFTAAGTAVCVASAAPTWSALTGFPAACTAGTVLAGFNTNGTANCVTDNVGVGTLTGLTVGSGLVGGGTSGSVAIGLSNACTAGQILKFDGANWGCAVDEAGAASGGTVTSVSATPNTVFSVATPTSTPAITMNKASNGVDGYLSGTDWATFNSKLSSVTPADIAACTTIGDVLKWDGAQWTCQQDANSGTITSVSVGSGMVGGGTAGNVTVGLTTACSNGYVLKSDGLGNWGCANDNDTVIGYVPPLYIDYATGNISISLAGASADGYLSSSDWAYFDSKLGNVTGSVSGTNIADGAIATADLANGAVTGAKIASATITGANVNTGTTLTAADFVYSTPKTGWVIVDALSCRRGGSGTAIDQDMIVFTPPANAFSPTVSVSATAVGGYDFYCPVQVQVPPGASLTITGGEVFMYDSGGSCLLSGTLSYKPFGQSSFGTDVATVYSGTNSSDYTFSAGFSVKTLPAISLAVGTATQVYLQGTISLNAAGSATSCRFGGARLSYTVDRP